MINCFQAMLSRFAFSCKLRHYVKEAREAERVGPGPTNENRHLSKREYQAEVSRSRNKGTMLGAAEDALAVQSRERLRLQREQEEKKRSDNARRGRDELQERLEW